MTVANYSTDLATVDLADSGGTVWVETTPWAGGGTPAAETDYFIQGTQCMSAAAAKGTAITASMMTPAVANFTVPTDGAVLIWAKYDHPNSLANEAGGGIRTIIGNGVNQFYGWKQYGSDTYATGGWICLATNDTVAADYTGGSAPSSPYQRAGLGYVFTYSMAPKGAPSGADCCRVGRCEARFYGGTSTDAPCTFAGFAAVNDSNTAGAYNRWGLIQAIAGGFLWQGLINIGYSQACRFTDSGVNVTIARTNKVTANFNKIEIRNASTEVNWTAINFLALSTVARGNLEVVDDCNVNISACSFTGMGTFIWKAASDILSSTFRNCGQITANGANFSGTVFAGYEGAANSSYMLWNTNVNTSGKLNNCSFTKGAAATHAIEIADSGLTAFTLVNVTFNSYNAANNQNDSALHIKKASGVVTITIQGGTTPSYRTDGATVDFVTSSVDVIVAAKDIGGNNVVGARIFLKASEGGHDLPFEVTVTITNSGTTATVAHTAHNLKTNDKVLIDGASLWQNNGCFAVTKTDDDHYTYTLPEAPGSNPTGTIKATFVALEGLSGADGTLSTSRSYSANQPVVGWVRKSSAQPYYKPSPLGGSISSAGGYSATAVMILDQ